MLKELNRPDAGASEAYGREGGCEMRVKEVKD